MTSAKTFTPIGDMRPDQIAVGDLVQNLRDRMLGHIIEMPDGYVTFQWLDRKRQITQHPSRLPQVPAAWIGQIDAESTPLLLDQMSLDMLDANSASLVLKELDYSRETVCDRLLIALEAWTWKTIMERRSDDVVSSWRAMILDAARRVIEAGHPGTTALQMKMLANMIVRARGWTTDDEIAPHVLEIFDRVKGVHLDVQQIAYGIRADDMAVARCITRLCFAGELMRIDRGDGSAVTYGRGTEGKAYPLFMIDQPIPFPASDTEKS